MPLTKSDSVDPACAGFAHELTDPSSFNARATRVYRNTGLDYFDRSSVGTVSFYDVADVDGLTSALDRAQAPKR